jgi:hypothetical protein
VTEHLVVGHQRPLRMRRLGAHHVVVLPHQQAQLLDMHQVRRSAAELARQITTTEAQLVTLKARRAELVDTLAQFEKMPIVRIDDDPTVPQPEPPASPAPDAPAT